MFSNDTSRFTWEYKSSVISIDECPNHDCTIFGAIPASRHLVAKLWRQACKLICSIGIGPVFPDRFFLFFLIHCKDDLSKDSAVQERHCGCLFLPANTSPSKPSGGFHLPEVCGGLGLLSAASRLLRWIPVAVLSLCRLLS